MSEREVDVIIVGAGPAGEVAAGRLGDAGLETVLVEDRLVGGECSFWACMPSKALLRPAQAVAEARRIPGAAEAVTGDLDVAAVLKRRDEIIHDLDDSGMLPWLEEKGVELIRGVGRLDGERQVRIGDDVLTAREAVILSVGSAPAIPPVPGLREAAPWTNEEVTTAKHVPGRLVVLGGGVVGVEMAQAYATLGSTVSLIEAGERVLAREEPFASEQIDAALQELGVSIHCGAKVASVLRHDDTTVTVTLEDGTELTGDELLCATGRRHKTDDLGVDTIGLEPGGPISVGEDMRVDGHPWLYAVGDVNGRALLTHMGKYQARVAAETILGRETRVMLSCDGGLSPRVVFTEPQVAAVGHTEASAREQGLAVRVLDVSTEGNAGGSFYGRNAAGTCRLVVDTERDLIAGATFTGVDVGDWIHAATIAIVGKVTMADLWHAVPSFPTRSEIWLKFTEAYEVAA